MMGERRVMQEALFYGFSLERHVPDGHLLRKIDRFGHAARLICGLQVLSFSLVEYLRLSCRAFQKIPQNSALAAEGDQNAIRFHD